MRAFWVGVALVIVIGLCCCGQWVIGIDPPPINTPTPVESAVP